MLSLNLDDALLRRIAIHFSFPLPAESMVLFGIRGAIPSGSVAGFASNHELTVSHVDHVHLCCTLGQWLPAQNECAVFLGSTVPAGAYIESALEGRGRTNQMLPGRYTYRRGHHGINSPDGHRALRQASFAPVRRTRDDARFQPRDPIDFGNGPGDFVWDNIHAAHTVGRRGFSSAGCQVVCGLPNSAKRRNAPEEGPWKEFVRGVYDQAAQQTDFSYLLFTFEDAVRVAATPDSLLRSWICYGSTGPAARAVQQALITKGFLAAGGADGDFGRKSLMALEKFQRSVLGDNAADGVCGPKTAGTLGMDLFPVAKTTPAVPLPPVPNGVLAVDEEKLPDETLHLLSEKFRQRIEGAPILPSAQEAGDHPNPDPGDLRERMTDLMAAVAHLTNQRAEGMGLMDAQLRSDVEKLLAKPPLTPVNAALGEQLGRFLDGRKTLIGILGSVAAAVIHNAQPDGWISDVSQAVTSNVHFLTGATDKIIPVTVAMTAWGFFGKMEKAILGCKNIAEKANGRG